VVLWLLVAALAGGCPEEAEDPLPPLELDPTVALRDNPDNPFSVFAVLTNNKDVQDQV